MRVAAIDVGSNSTRLLVADIEKNKIIPVCTGLKTTRLGEGITGGRLVDAAMERTITVIRAFLEQAGRAGAREIIMAATSAVRDAANREEFVHAVRSATGEQLAVLSGTEEARLSYLGVTASFGAVQNALVIDIGGGSTEFIWAGNGETRCISVRAGAVRMTEGGYGRGQVTSAIAPALGMIKQDCPGDVIGVGGTVTTLAAMAQELRRYDPNKVHGFRLRVETVDLLYRRLHGLTVAERSRLPGLQPERADIIPAGAWILSSILKGLGRESVLVSEADILYGLVLEVAGAENV